MSNFEKYVKKINDVDMYFIKWTDCDGEIHCSYKFFGGFAKNGIINKKTEKIHEEKPNFVKVDSPYLIDYMEYRKLQAKKLRKEIKEQESKIRSLNNEVLLNKKLLKEILSGSRLLFLFISLGVITACQATSPPIELVEINNAVNRVTYVHEEKQKWDDYNGFIKNGGDCEEFAMLKIGIINHLDNWKAKRRIGNSHAWAEVCHKFHEDDCWILDNLSPYIYRKE